MNEKLLREVVAVIETDPEAWDQDEYANACGTTFCVGGHALLLNGWRYDAETRDWFTRSGRRPWFVDVQPKAAEALGLTVAEADDVFTWGVSWKWPHAGHPSVAQLKVFLTERLGVRFDDDDSIARR